MNLGKITDEDFKALEEAKATRDWSNLTTWKQRFMYQRYVAMPANNTKAVKEIGLKSRDILYGMDAKQDSLITEIFDTDSNS